jgi:hypothetical protein
MDHSAHNSIVSFIWNIADDVLRDISDFDKFLDLRRKLMAQKIKTWFESL